VTVYLLLRRIGGRKNVLYIISRKEAGVRTERLCTCCCGGQKEGGMYCTAGY